jgi:hypothetical protein
MGHLSYKWLSVVIPLLFLHGSLNIQKMGCDAVAVLLLDTIISLSVNIQTMAGDAVAILWIQSTLYWLITKQ